MIAELYSQLAINLAPASAAILTVSTNVLLGNCSEHQKRCLGTLYFFSPFLLMESSTGKQADNKPVFKCKYGAVSASVFANEVTDGDNKPSVIHAVQLQRTYKDAGGKWAVSATLREQDLLHAAFALQKCLDFIHRD